MMTVEALTDRLSLKLLEQLSLGLILIDRTGTVIWANQKQAEYTNIHPQHLIGESFYEYAGFRDSGLDAVLRSVVENGIRWSNPEAYIAFNQPGSRYRTEFIPIFDDDEVIGGAILFWDVTEHVKVAADTERLRKQIHAILAIMKDQVFIIDRAFIIQRLSQNLIEGNGEKHSARFIGNPCYQAFFNRQEPCQGCPAIICFEKGTRAESYIKDTQGALPIRNARAIPVRDSKNNVLQSVVSCLAKTPTPQNAPDVTWLQNRISDLEQKIEGLQALNQFNSDLLYSLPYQAVVIDYDFNILFTNQKDIQSGSIIGKNLFKAMPVYDVVTFRDYIQQYMENEDADQFESEKNFISLENVRHYLRKLDLGTDLQAILILSQNVQNDQKDAKRICAEKYESLSRFAAQIVHDIRNPLSSILTRLELLKNPEAVTKNGEASSHSEIDSIQEQANRIVALLEKIEAIQAQPKEKLVKTDLGSVLERACIVAELQRPNKHVHVKLEISDDMPMLFCYPSRLERALGEIIMNALEASQKDDVMVAVVYEEDTSTFRITVKDTGVGIAEQDLIRIYDPFFTTKADVKGAGLGLTIAYAVIMEHGGSLSIKSTLNVGTVATIILPESQYP